LPKTTGILDRDIYHAANVLIRQHGDRAELFAAQRADLMIDRGDHDGQLVWLLIKRAIVALQATPRGKPH
jgi:hypothetical protein